MRGSVKRVFGWSIASVAVTGFIATGAFAEQPSHLVTRPPRVDVQRPHAPHAVHKPHPESRVPLNDQPPHVVRNIAPGTSSVVTHTHINVHVVPITHVRPPRKTHTVVVVQIDHNKTLKKH